jgi:hypothetical protein
MILFYTIMFVISIILAYFFGLSEGKKTAMAQREQLQIDNRDLIHKNKRLEQENSDLLLIFQGTDQKEGIVTDQSRLEENTALHD